MTCKTIDRKKLTLSNWQECNVSPTISGWYEVKAMVGYVFESGKYCWMYWDNAKGRWRYPERDANPFFSVKYDLVKLPTTASSTWTYLLDGDQWRGVING